MYTSVKCLALLLFTNTLSSEMAFINEGRFNMGQKNNLADEVPVHRLFVSAFFISQNEVTLGDWKKVVIWAEYNGYNFSNHQYDPRPGIDRSGDIQPDQFPMNSITWYDAVKWCNARSEMEGRTPCYYLDTQHNIVYRKGKEDIDSDMVNWKASGFRLPTEAEWEKAARGKYSGYNYPWGTKIDEAMANYKNSKDPFESGIGGISPIGYYDGNQTIHLSKNLELSDMKNSNGLYDVIGNISEWCWDWYDEGWYKKSKSKVQDTTGPTFSEATKYIFEGVPLDGKRKVHRGGAFDDGPTDEGKPLRIAFRHVEYPHSYQWTVGLRFVRSNVEDELWLGMDSFDNYPNWYFVNWFGYFYQKNSRWVFHTQFGWIYPQGLGSYDNWIYFLKHGWMWTSKLVFPYFYSSEDETWYKYLQNNYETGWFKNYLTEEKKRLGRIYP